MRKYRGRGAGAQAASSLFAQFPGRWTVRQQLTNPAATTFWRKAIRYPFQEHEQDAEIVQSFTSADMNG
jgi:predicted acetyltransferase